MQSWLIDGIMAAVAYCAADHFLERKIKGVKRILFCVAIAVVICCIIRFIADSVSN